MKENKRRKCVESARREKQLTRDYTSDGKSPDRTESQQKQSEQKECQQKESQQPELENRKESQQNVSQQNESQQSEMQNRKESQQERVPTERAPVVRDEKQVLTPTF